MILNINSTILTTIIKEQLKKQSTQYQVKKNIKKTKTIVNIQKVYTQFNSYKKKFSIIPTPNNNKIPIYPFKRIQKNKCLLNSKNIWNNKNFKYYVLNNSLNATKMKYHENKKKKLITLLPKTPIEKINKKISIKNYWKFKEANIVVKTIIKESKMTVLNFNTANTISKYQKMRLNKQALIVFPFLQLNRVTIKLTNAIFSLMCLKDTSPISTFIKNILEKIHYSKHTVYFNHVGFLVKQIIAKQLTNFNCLGVRIIFRGKLGVGGSVRKRSLKFSTGLNSSSSKFIKLNRTTNVIRTKTGVVGFSVLIAW